MKKITPELVKSVLFKKSILIIFFGLVFIFFSFHIDARILRPIATFISVDLAHFNDVISSKTANFLNRLLYGIPDLFWKMGIIYFLIGICSYHIDRLERLFRPVFIYLQKKGITKISDIRIVRFVILLSIVLFGFYIRAVRLEQSILIDSDSFHYLLAAKQLRLTGEYLEPWGFDMLTPVYFPGFPLLISIFFSVISSSGHIANLINLYLGTLSIFMIFFIGRDTHSPTLGIILAFFLALTPVHVCTGAVAMSDVPSLFFIICAIFGLMKSMNSNNLVYPVITITNLTVAILIRYTNFLFLIPLAFLIFQKIANREKNQYTTLIHIFSSTLLISLIYPAIRVFQTGRIDFWWPSTVAMNPHFPFLYKMVKFEYIFQTSLHGVSPLPKLLRIIGTIMFSPSFYLREYLPDFSPFIGIFAIIGFIKMRNKIKIFSNYFLGFWILVPLLFFSMHYYLEIRYFLLILIPIYIYGALGLLWFIKKLFPSIKSLFQINKKITNRLLLLILIIILLYSGASNFLTLKTVSFCPTVKSISTAFTVNEKPTPFGLFFSKIPKDTLIISGRWIELKYNVENIVIPIHLTNASTIKKHYPEGTDILLHTATTYNFGENYDEIFENARSELCILDPEKYPIKFTKFPQSKNITKYLPCHEKITYYDQHFSIY